MEEGSQVVDRRVHIAVVERRTEIEPRSARKLAGAWRQIDLSIDLHRADEPLAGCPEYHGQAARRGLGIDFDAGIFTRTVEPLDCAADIRKMQRGAFGKSD